MRDRGAMDGRLRDQVTRLVGVLRDLAPAAHPPVRHVDAHAATLWLDELRVHLAAAAPGELLRLRRVRPEPQPPAPAEVAGWVETGGDVEPVLHDRGPLHGRRAFLIDAPGVRDAFDAWMAAWRPWAHRERTRRAQDGPAARLTELARLGDDPSRELVLGAGLLHLPADGVHVHVVAQPVRITEDPATGELVCVATGPPAPADRGSAGLRSRLGERTPTVLAPGLVEALTGWVADIPVDAGWSRPVGPAAVLAVAPALVVRERAPVALDRCYDEIERSLRAGPVPPGLARLVCEPSPAERTGLPALDAPLLPLPATEEQTRVVTALARGSGVVVEGPAGTGKTHTLANLLGALLAAGQRVLVTSGDAGSLRVLRDRLPAGLQDLCAGPEAGGVARVAGERTEFDPVRADRRIADLAARRTYAAHTRDELLTRIALLREAEARVHPDIAPGYGGTPAQIAAALLRSAPRDAWVPGPVRGRAPLTAPEFAELQSLLAEQTPRHRRRRGQVIAPGPLTVAGLARIADAVEGGPQLRPGADTELATALGDLGPDARTALERLAGEVIDAVGGLRSVPGAGRWAPATADRLLGEGPSRGWLEALAELDAVDVVIDHDRRAGGTRIEIAAGTDEFAAAQVFEHLAGYLDEGGALRRVFKGGEQRAAEKLGRAVLVDGAPPRTRGAALAAVHHLAVRRIAGRIDDVFAPLGTGIPYGPGAVGSMLDLRAACVAVERVLAAAGAVRRVLAELAPQARPPLGSAADLERVARLGLVARAARAAWLAHRELADAVATLQSVPAARRAPEQNPVSDALRALDVPAYTAALHALDVAGQEQHAQRRADELLDRVRAAAPALATALVDGSTADPERWERAWARARAATWMEQQPAAEAGSRLDAELAVATGVVQSLTTELAVALAWRACLLRIDTTQARALQAYRHAAAQARAGTGEGTQRLRAGAREAMAVALSAVPAWLLPVPALLETIAHRPGAFDVVIVDEATRLDPSCAFLSWLAPRIVVVGDEGQCPPPTAGLPDHLAAALPDVPGHLHAALGRDGNLFALLRTRLDAVVRLRGHFRGAPEIAAWSAAPREAPAVPLRRSGAGGVPPLRSTHVPGRARVRVLAETVAACAADPAYAGRTFGVVVPGGPADVEKVAAALAERLDPAAWAARRLRVGGPQDLRGDERDVVWLSVPAGGPPLLGAAAVQDYELAVSRARDQLWVVHSVRPDQLAAGDVRRSLLEHVLAVEPVLGPVPTGVRRDRRDDRFDSLFEQAVFLDLVERGFHVVPQVTCNGRRIDLVVTGSDGTLAVECDGQAFRTTPERRAADLAREQELIACGWGFVRVRESVHLLDPAAALAPVWAALAERGIEPLGGLVDGVWTVRAEVTEALPVLHLAADDGGEADPGEPDTGATATAEFTAPVAAPAPVRVGFDAAATMVRPRGFGTASAAGRPAAGANQTGVGGGGTGGGGPAAGGGATDGSVTVATPTPDRGSAHSAAVPADAAATATQPDPEVAVRMPGPRITSEPDPAGPAPTGRHALRESPEVADPTRTPAPLFDATRRVADPDARAFPGPAPGDAAPGDAAPEDSTAGDAAAGDAAAGDVAAGDVAAGDVAAGDSGPGAAGPGGAASGGAVAAAGTARAADPPAETVVDHLTTDLARGPAPTLALTGDSAPPAAPAAEDAAPGAVAPGEVGRPASAVVGPGVSGAALFTPAARRSGRPAGRGVLPPPDHGFPWSPVVPDRGPLADTAVRAADTGSPRDGPLAGGMRDETLSGASAGWPPTAGWPPVGAAPGLSPPGLSPPDRHPPDERLLGGRPSDERPMDRRPAEELSPGGGVPYAGLPGGSTAGERSSDECLQDGHPSGERLLGEWMPVGRPSVGPAPGRRGTLLDVAGRRPLTTAAVRNLLGVGPEAARELLTDLADEGVLVRRGEGRTTHWVPADPAPA